MNIYEIIAKKRDKHELSYGEMQFWLNGYLAGQIPDYQSAALLMAIFINGLSKQETFDLTKLVVESGRTIDLSGINGKKVDKHSSGGVGDKTTLVTAPIMAAAGLKVAKMSGRGLGHTGGTLDKLESIEGFRVSLTAEEFEAQVNKHGIAIISQTDDLVPADKKLYALRDVTATVNCIPLIAVSIMGKKLAVGADVIVLDVKYGRGAFMPDAEKAVELAELMIRIGQYYGRKVSAVISSMDAPLGWAVGNALEVDEAILTLQNRGPRDLHLLSVALAGEALLQSNSRHTRQDAYGLAEKMLRSGKAWRKFVDMVGAQGGNVGLVKSPPITNAAISINIGAVGSGYVTAIDALKVGNVVRELGGGRLKKDDVIKPNVGVVIHKKIGDHIEEGECVATIYSEEIIKATEIGAEFFDVFTVSQEAVAPDKLIYGVVDKDGFIPWTALETQL